MRLWFPEDRRNAGWSGIRVAYPSRMNTGDSSREYRPPEGFERWCLELSWHGGAFRGWQLQPQARSVQGVLHAGLTGLCGDARHPVAAGRTDSGVHAERMVAHADLRAPRTRELARALNAVLPRDLAVLRAAPAPAGFHARFSCVGRHYRYLLLVSPQRRPLWAGRAWHSGPLDVGAMAAAAALLPGRRDFAAFATREDRHTVRELRAVTLHPQGELLEVRLSGESFLRHMVRGIVGSLVEVGRGRSGPEELARALASGERAQTGPNLPAHGLHFVGADYPAVLGGPDEHGEKLSTPPCG